MPEGSELKFGYKFGKLSLAIGPKIERRQAKPKGTLGDWLNGQREAGHAA